VHRTQISLEREHYELLAAEARRRGVSLAAVVRDLIAGELGKSARRRRAVDPLARITGIGAGTGESVGRNHNRFLYGRKRA
jgi:hypothetical protein